MALPPDKGGMQPRVMIAFSGGLDSTVLLHAAALLLGPQALLAVHVNHRLQPAAASFERHVRARCKAWGVALKVGRLADSPPGGASIEAWAREQRYRFFQHEADRLGIRDLFTAHHRDDQLETLFIALSRGAGLQGLAGIAPERRVASLTVHRPLLACSRDQLLAHAHAYGLDWIEDPSNRQTRFLRNRLRHEVLPALERALPGFGQQALASQRHLADAALAERAARTGAGAGRVPGTPAVDSDGASPAGPGVLSRSSLRSAALALARVQLRQWLQSRGLKAPPAGQLDDWLRAIRQAGSGPLRLAGPGWTLRIQRERLWIEQQGAPSPILSTGAGWRWPLPAYGGQLLILPAAGFTGQGVTGPGQPDQASIQPELQVRPPRSSDKLLTAPGRPRRTLKNLFQEHGIEAGLRQRLPCIWQGDRLLHVPGLGTDPGSPWTFHFLPDL